MAHLVLYRKYRPQKFSEIAGQSHIVKTITNQIKFDDIAHGYLFSGSRGSGKTTIARLIAKALNCEQRKESGEPCNKCSSCLEINEGQSLDLIEIDAASNRGIDEIRELREKIRFAPTKGKYKVYIIDEVHMLTKEAFNALLKTLEEPPAHVVFILATTEIGKIPATIISRTQRFDFKKLSVDEIIKKLKEIAKKEEIEIDAKALQIIALNADGAMRDAASLLGQVMSVEDKKITSDEVESILGKSSQESIIALADFMVKKDLRQAVLLVNAVLNDGFDLSRFTKEFIGYLRKTLLVKIGLAEQETDFLKNTFTAEQIQKVKEHARGLDAPFLMKAIKLFSNSEMNTNIFPQLGLELALVELLGNGYEDGESGESKSGNNPGNAGTQPVMTVQPSVKPPTLSSGSEIHDKPKNSDTYSTKASAEKKHEPSPAIVSDEKVIQPVSHFEQSGELSLQEIKDKWSGVVNKTKAKNYTAAAFLKQCVPLGQKNEYFFIASKFDFHKEKLSESKTRYSIEEVLADMFSQKFILRFVNEQEALDSGFKVSLEDKSQKTLNDALDILGGEIVG